MYVFSGSAPLPLTEVLVNHLVFEPWSECWKNCTRKTVHHCMSKCLLFFCVRVLVYMHMAQHKCIHTCIVDTTNKLFHVFSPRDIWQARPAQIWPQLLQRREPFFLAFWRSGFHKLRCAKIHRTSIPAYGRDVLGLCRWSRKASLLISHFLAKKIEHEKSVNWQRITDQRSI